MKNKKKLKFVYIHVVYKRPDVAQNPVFYCFAASMNDSYGFFCDAVYCFTVLDMGATTGGQRGPINLGTFLVFFLFFYM